MPPRLARLFGRQIVRYDPAPHVRHPAAGALERARGTVVDQSAAIVEKQFGAWWVDLEADVAAAIAAKVDGVQDTAPTPTKTERTLDELLSLARDQQRAIAGLLTAGRQQPPSRAHSGPKPDRLATCIEKLNRWVHTGSADTTPQERADLLGALTIAMERIDDLSQIEQDRVRSAAKHLGVSLDSAAEQPSEAIPAGPD